jgi:Ca2+/Na+ antiporter
VISNFNFETADGILQSGGTANVIIGAIIPLLGLITPTAIVILRLLFIANRIGEHSKAITIAAMILLGLTSLIISPAWYLLPIPVYVIASVLPLIFPANKTRSDRISNLEDRTRNNATDKPRQPARHRQRNPRERFTAFWVVVYIAFAFVSLVSESAPWVPSEIIAAKGFNHSFTGYIFSETDTDVTILTARTKTIIHIRTSDLISRTVCEQRGIAYNGFFLETLPQFLFGNDQSHYRQCVNL